MNKLLRRSSVRDKRMSLRQQRSYSEKLQRKSPKSTELPATSSRNLRGQSSAGSSSNIRSTKSSRLQLKRNSRTTSKLSKKSPVLSKQKATPKENFELLQSMCLICRKKDSKKNEMIPLNKAQPPRKFLKFHTKKSMLDLLTEIQFIDMKILEKSSSVLCIECCTTLQSAYQLKLLCQQSEEFWKNSQLKNTKSGKRLAPISNSTVEESAKKRRLNGPEVNGNAGENVEDDDRSEVEEIETKTEVVDLCEDNEEDDLGMETQKDHIKGNIKAKIVRPKKITKPVKRKSTRKIKKPIKVKIIKKLPKKSVEKSPPITNGTNEEMTSKSPTKVLLVMRTEDDCKEFKKIVCQLCMINFYTEYCFLKHIRRLHLSHLFVTIIPYEKFFIDGKNLKKLSFLCRQCSIFSYDTEKFYNHLQTHNRTASDKCCFCDAECPDLIGYYHHLKLHFINKYEIQ